MSLREYMAMPAQSAEIDDRAVRFDELDRDQDGFAAPERMGGMASRSRRWTGTATGRSRRASSAAAADDPALQFRAMDGNRDGVLTRWEWSGTRDCSCAATATATDGSAGASTRRTRPCRRR